MNIDTEKRNSELKKEKMETLLIENDLKSKEIGCLMETGVQTEWKYFNIEVEKKDAEVQTESNFHESEHSVAKTHVEVQTVEMSCEITKDFTSEDSKEKEILLEFFTEKADMTFFREETSSDFDAEMSSLENDKERNYFTVDGKNSENVISELEKQRGDIGIGDTKIVDSEQHTEKTDFELEKRNNDPELDTEKIDSEQETEKIDSKQETDKTDSEQDAEKIDSEQETEKIDSEQDAEKIDSEQEREKIASEQDTEKTDSELDTENIASEQDAEKIDSEQDTENIASEQDTEKTVSELDTEIIASEQDTERIDSDQDTEKIASEQNTEKIYSEQDAEKIASEQDTENIASEQDTEKIDSELDTENIASEQDKEKIDSEKDTEKIDSEQDAEKIASEQDAEKIDSEQDAEKIDYEQDTENIASEQDTEKIDSELDTENIASEQDKEKIDSEKDTEKIDSEQDAEKIASEQDAEKIDSEQDAENIDYEQDTENIASEQDKEKTDSELDTENIASEGDTEKIDSKKDTEKIDSEQDAEKIPSEQDTEKINSEQDAEKIDSEQDKENIVSEQDAEKADSQQDRERIDSEQDREKTDPEANKNTTGSINIPENSSFTCEAENIQFVRILDKTVVIDAGSLTVKAGFAGDENPKAYFPNIVGEPKKTAISLQCPSKNNSLLVAKEAESKVPILRVRYPVVNGQIEEWDDMVEILCHAIEHEIDVDDVSQYVMVMITETEDGQRLMQLLFQLFKPRAVLLVNQAILSLFASGRSTGVVINFGEGTSQVVPIFERCIIQHAVRNWGCNGLELTKKLMEMLDISETPVGLIRTRGIKEKFCYVASDPNDEKENIKYEECELPDGTEISIGPEKFQCPEVLFEDCRIHEIVVKVIESCDKDIQGELFKNIVLAGGSTMLPGFPERLEKEIRALVGETKEFHIITPPDRNLSAWRGGSKISSTDLFLCDLYSKDEFDNKGPMHYF